MKRALITSGGGAKGAFTVGALKYLSDKGIKNFDIISGTSTGSLIAAMATINDLDPLIQLYSTVDNDQILDINNIANNLLHNQPYLYDTDPLQKIINTYLTNDKVKKILESDTILCLTAVSLFRGEITIFCNKDIPPRKDFYRVQRMKTKKDLVDALTASSSQAGFLKPVSINTAPAGQPVFMEQFVDGGHMQVVPTRVVTNYDLEEIYVLSNNPMGIFEGKTNYTSVLDVILRAISIFIQDVRTNDFSILEQYAAQHPNTKVYTICPDRDIDIEHPTGLNFVPQIMKNWISLGKNTAKKVLTSPPTNFAANG